MQHHGYGNVFGSRAAAGSGEYQLSLYNGGLIGIGSRNGSLGFNTSDIHHISFDGNNTVNIDETTKTISIGSSIHNESIILFGIRDGSSVTQLQAGKIYMCKFGNERNFIPCYRKSDGAIGMYDTVNNYFYTNQGEGCFSKGNNVN